MPILFLAVLLSCAIITVTNDMYAFVKPEREVTLVINKGQTVDEISQQLAQNGIVSNPFVFSSYVKSKGKIVELEKYQGEITLNSAMSYREILAVFI